MAAYYTNTFTLLGKVQMELLRFDAYQSANLVVGGSYGYDTLANSFESQNRNDLISGLYNSYVGFNNSLQAWEQRLFAVASGVIADLAASLNAPSKAVSVVLPLLVKDMLIRGDYLATPNVVTATPTAYGSNVGNGTMVVSKVGVDGTDNEHLIADSIKVLCASDQYSIGSTGQDRFTVNGSGTVSPYSYLTKKARTGGSLTLAEADNLMLNGSFETFTVTNTPDSWTLDAGAVTTNFIKETTNVFRTGTYSLNLNSNATATAVTLHQSLSSVVSLGKRYAIQCQLRRNGALTSAVSNLDVSISGTGITTVHLFNADPSTLTTAFVAYSGTFALPTVIPSDLKFEIAWTTVGAITSGEKVIVDHVTLVEMTEFDHVFMSIFQGSTDFQIGDYYTVAAANDYAGKFQTMFARFFDTKLPTAVTTNAIADTLITYP